MRSVNKVILIGNLTRDPEMRQTSNGQNVVTFGLATNRDWTTRDGRKQSTAEFHDVVAWAKLADICKQYLRKGKLVYVEGYLKTRSWDSPEGVKKFKTEIVVNDMIMLDKKSTEENEEFILEPQAEAEPQGEPAPQGEAEPQGEPAPQGEAEPQADPAPQGEPAPQAETETNLLSATARHKRSIRRPKELSASAKREKTSAAEKTPAAPAVDIDQDLGL